MRTPAKLHMARKLRSVLNQKLDAQFAEFEVERIMANGFVENEEEKSGEIIKKEFDQNLNEIEAACKNNGWNVKYCKLIFIGGTSQMLKEQIQDRYPNAFIPEDSGFTNAEGFMKGLCIQLKIAQ